MKPLSLFRTVFIFGLSVILSMSEISPRLYASVIGNGTVTGSGALTTNINWNDTFVGSSASGTINGIVVTGRVLPTLNMTISGSGTLTLGNLSSTTYSTGTVDIEIGTNAVNGASVSAQSTNGGLQNTSNSSIIINSLSTDGAADSYKFVSVLGTTDSTALGFTQSGAIDVEINSTSATTIYSSNKPQPLTNIDDFTFSVVAKPNGQTPAGDYRDVIKITVSGNF
ncbi:MAG: hypothetical protein PHY14_03415 [Candidatus Gracilibacteria bacterium]|nr:hypothetical protein [Candidatus Gracilibacteria bacterium]